MAKPTGAHSQPRGGGLSSWIEPQLATLTHERFSDPAWIFERKLDGERCLAFAGSGGVRLPPRRGVHSVEPRLVGQIVIFTLLDGSVPAFDAMIGSVTEQVRAGEPGTLVFIVHAVPSAPQQRILYEVYRDRDASQAHQQQPYLMRFEQDRREHVLATNVIELSLQPAKVSQLPALGQPMPAGGSPLPGSSIR